MKRFALISYLVKGKKVEEIIWVDRINPNNFNSSVILLKIFINKDTAKAVKVVNRSGVSQYMANEPITDGAYAYISTNAMKALMASGNVRSIQGAYWIRLNLAPITPSLADFGAGEIVSSIK